MKKTYIAPATRAYAVNTKGSMLYSVSNTEVDDALVKEQKEEKGSGIWDLYN